MYQAAVHQNVLCAVPHPHTATGYKDRKDPCHRKASKAYLRRATTPVGSCLCLRPAAESRGAFTPIEATPLKFREDGQPISACRLPGRPLMVPKRPDMESLAAASRCTAAHQRSSRIQCAAMPFLHATRIGDPARTDPSRFCTTARLFYQRPPRLLAQPNPLIAAATAKRLHRGLEFTHAGRAQNP